MCEQKYGFDKKWAEEDPESKKRIERYEAGDKTVFSVSVPLATPQPASVQQKL
jgi:hypothetical protein